jgi:hypothetical protein
MHSITITFKAYISPESVETSLNNIRTKMERLKVRNIAHVAVAHPTTLVGKTSFNNLRTNIEGRGGTWKYYAVSFNDVRTNIETRAYSYNFCS